MYFFSILLLFSSLGNCAYGLRCYQGNFDNADYEPKAQDAVDCPSDAIECVSGFIDTVKPNKPEQQAIFSCDTQDLCQAVGNNSCEYNDESMTCCCDTDLCNNGRKYAPIPSTLPTTPKFSSFQSFIPTFIIIISYII